MAKAQKKGIPASRQDWPNHDETWFEFMCRTEKAFNDMICIGAGVVLLLVVIFALIAEQIEQY